MQESAREPERLEAGEGLRRVLVSAIAELKGALVPVEDERERLATLLDRLESERFHLAVLGQFKRGKSTLLNALLGEAVLPSAILPVTALPTVIEAGERRAARVRLEHDGREEVAESGEEGLTDFLDRYVNESSNPENRAGVKEITVTLPAEILRRGVVLIDTPGIGSVHQHNTVATLNFLGECDAALFVTSPDPPLTEVEVGFLKEVKGKVPRLFFVLNKADYLEEGEREAAVAFLKEAVERHAGLAAEPLFVVSAKRGLAARERGDAAAWEASGMAALEAALVGFLAGEKRAVLARALTLRARDCLAGARMKVGLFARSLRLPAEELAQRRARFEERLAEAERQRQGVLDRLAGEGKRIKEELSEAARELRRASVERLDAVVGSVHGRPGDPGWEEAVNAALAEAIPPYFEARFGEVSERFRRRIGETLTPLQAEADRLIEGLRRNAADIFEIPFTAPESEPVFEAHQRPYWVAHPWRDTLMAIPPTLLDLILPVALRRNRVRQRVRQQIERLVAYNVENLHWSIVQSIDTSFRRFAYDMEHTLTRTIEATREAIEIAAARRTEAEQSVAADLAEAERLEAALAALAERLGEPAAPPAAAG
ncbi:MAG: Dynamin family protein [Nitrospirae bacterium]|nr:MAG: Dynamin family protein [Nitrospirota bacterium]